MGISDKLYRCLGPDNTETLGHAITGLGKTIATISTWFIASQLLQNMDTNDELGLPDTLAQNLVFGASGVVLGAGIIQLIGRSLATKARKEKEVDRFINNRPLQFSEENNWKGDRNKAVSSFYKYDIPLTAISAGFRKSAHLVIFPALLKFKEPYGLLAFATALTMVSDVLDGIKVHKKTKFEPKKKTIIEQRPDSIQKQYSKIDKILSNDALATSLTLAPWVIGGILSVSTMSQVAKDSDDTAELLKNVSSEYWPLIPMFAASAGIIKSLNAAKNYRDMSRAQKPDEDLVFNSPIGIANKVINNREQYFSKAGNLLQCFTLPVIKTVGTLMLLKGFLGFYDSLEGECDRVSSTSGALGCFDEGVKTGIIAEAAILMLSGFLEISGQNLAVKSEKTHTENIIRRKKNSTDLEMGRIG